MLPDDNHRVLLEVRLDGGRESYILPLIARRMFPRNLTNDDLPKPSAHHLAKHIILKSYTDGILAVKRTVIM